MSAIITGISYILYIYMWIIIVAALMTWINPDPRNQVVLFFRKITEPVMGYVRRFIPTRFGGLDIAPLVVILLIIFLREVVLDSLLLNLQGY